MSCLLAVLYVKAVQWLMSTLVLLLNLGQSSCGPLEMGKAAQPISLQRLKFYFFFYKRKQNIPKYWYFSSSFFSRNWCVLWIGFGFCLFLWADDYKIERQQETISATVAAVERAWENKCVRHCMFGMLVKSKEVPKWGLSLNMLILKASLFD